MNCPTCGKDVDRLVASARAVFDAADWHCSTCSKPWPLTEENRMKTEDQIKDIINTAERRLDALLAEHREQYTSYLDRKAEEIRQRMRAELLTPAPNPLAGLPPALVLNHAIRTYDSEPARAVCSVEIRTMFGPNYQLNFDDVARDHDAHKSLKPGRHYAVVIAFYELNGGEP